MTDDEKLYLVETGKSVRQLFGDRDDMVIGVTAVFLDLYRQLFLAGLDTKEAAMARLEIQRSEINRLIPSEMASRYLASMIAAMKEDRLDAAKLWREPSAGSA